MTLLLCAAATRGLLTAGGAAVVGGVVSAMMVGAAAAALQGAAAAELGMWTVCGAAVLGLHLRDSDGTNAATGGMAAAVSYTPTGGSKAATIDAAAARRGLFGLAAALLLAVQAARRLADPDAAAVHAVGRALDLAVTLPLCAAATRSLVANWGTAVLSLL